MVHLIHNKGPLNTSCHVTLVGNDRDQQFPVSLHQLCTHCSCYFFPILPDRSSQELWCFEAVAGQHGHSALGCRLCTLLPPNTASSGLNRRCILVSSNHVALSKTLDGQDMWWPQHGELCGVLQDFNPWRCSVTNSNLCDCDASSLQVMDQVLPV